MDRLILMRHGKAKAAAAGGDDFARPLAGEGRAASEAMARTLSELGHVPDLALVSSARRTQETWAATVGVFPEARARLERGLYLAEPEAIWAAVVAASEEADSLMVVGHNPGIHELALQLARRGATPGPLAVQLERGFPTGAAAVFRFDLGGRPACEGVFFPAKGAAA